MNRTVMKNTIPVSGMRMQPKVVIACVLMSIMAILWLRILFRGGPQSAQAAIAAAAPADTVTETASRPAIRIRPIELPRDPDIHSRPVRDPFKPRGTEWFAAAGTKAVPDNREVSEQERLRRMHRANLQALSERLILEAVIQDAAGNPEKACIDGQVLSVGSALRVREQELKYELTVREITNTQVTLQWQAFSITVKMTSSEWIE